MLSGVFLLFMCSLRDKDLTLTICQSIVSSLRFDGRDCRHLGLRSYRISLQALLPVSLTVPLCVIIPVVPVRRTGFHPD
jgi:hypothetical protein